MTLEHDHEQGTHIHKRNTTFFRFIQRGVIFLRVQPGSPHGSNGPTNSWPNLNDPNNYDMEMNVLIRSATTLGNFHHSLSFPKGSHQHSASLIGRSSDAPTRA